MTTDEKGFTLVEILVAMAILVIILSGVYAGISELYHIEKRVEYNTVARELARSVMEKSFIPNFVDFTSTETINDMLYTIKTNTKDIASVATATLQKVTVNVSYMPSGSTTKTVSIPILQIRMKR